MYRTVYRLVIKYLSQNEIYKVSGRIIWANDINDWYAYNIFVEN